ncbi:fasciclin domain-containing protein [Paracraurococcus lichenis]|uniref:Fasciclin domain-containing protein n=1 Tax=Paracraurococcus lichenis TaxID=3064888 RepID=A0ABT9E666_9PROT|nr:fasciclin domain-containing protein [Paracraurococcus sp. LOR1-02]MDO9711654.1 fasciclin domain-containing protein [Paracraurococcus sp. LOR1-02]
MKLARIAALGLLGLAFSAGAQAANVLETMRADPNLSTFVGMIDKSGIASQLTGSEKVTVLAPTNGAFDMVGPSDLRGIESNPQRLRSFVLGHMLSGQRTAIFGTEHTTASAKTLSGATIEVEGTGIGSGTINNHAKVVQGDIRADNGVIHKIDHPLGVR